MSHKNVIVDSHKIAVINVYEKNSGVGNVSLIYFETLQEILGEENVNFYQIYEKDNIVSPTNKAKWLLKLSGFPRWFTVPFARLLLLPKKCKKLSEKYLILADPTLCFHIKGDSKERIVLVHDLRPYTKFERMFFEKLFFSLIKPSLINCNIFLCDSYFTKNELCKIGVDSKKIEVIYPFFASQVDLLHIKTSLKKIERCQVSLTYIANDLPYKNIEFFLLLAKELETMQNLNIEFQFNLVSRKLSKNNLLFIEENSIKNLKYFEHAGNISDIYDITDILLHTSLYEGFGLPVIEAMSFGIPVIANRIEIMEEIISDSGILCSPNSLESWIKGIVALLDKDNYKKYTRLSILRASNFTKLKFEQSLKEFLRKNDLCSEC